MEPERAEFFSSDILEKGLDAASRFASTREGFDGKSVAGSCDREEPEKGCDHSLLAVVGDDVVTSVLARFFARGRTNS